MVASVFNRPQKLKLMMQVPAAQQYNILNTAASWNQVLHSPQPVQQMIQVPAAQHCRTMDTPTINTFMGRLESILDTMNQKLLSLDAICEQVKSIHVALAKFETRVTSIEINIYETNTRLTDLEASRAYESQTNDEIKVKCGSIEKSVMSDAKKLQAVASECATVTSQNNKIQEELLDLQTRSMRNNVLVFGIEECTSMEGRRAEDCVTKLHEFCENKLGIENAHDIKIDRAHRIGGFQGAVSSKVL